MAGQLHLFGGRRQRGRKLPAPLEHILQRQTAAIIDRWAVPGWMITHFPAGELRHPAVAKKLKAFGLKRGWADFLLLPPAPDLRLHQLELKRRGETLTENQEHMQQFCAVNGYPYEVVNTLDDAIAVLTRWGAVKGVHTVGLP
jgi:hypothetical protein